MTNNLTAQISRGEPKPEAVGSLSVGIISVLAFVIIILSKGDFPLYGWDISGNAILVSVKWDWLFAIIGIVLGIMGLKSSKKKLAVTGIVLSSISLVLYVALALLIYSVYCYIFEVFPFMLLR